MVTISGCTSIQTYGLHQINSELPIEVGDKIKIFLHDSSFSDLHIIVTEINEKSIRGKRVSGTKLEVTVPWNEIGRIEARQPDSSKTTLLVLIGIAILAAAKNLGIASMIYLMVSRAIKITDQGILKT